MATAPTLYREIDALGGEPQSASEYDRIWNDGYSAALTAALAILERRGFTEAADAHTAIIDALEPILDDLGRPGEDGWTDGYAHVTDLDRLQQAIAQAQP